MHSPDVNRKLSLMSTELVPLATPFPLLILLVISRLVLMRTVQRVV